MQLKRKSQQKNAHNKEIIKDTNKENRKNGMTTMKSIIKLRIVNSIGCLLFVFYGILLNPISIPIILTNVIIFCINLFYLVYKKK